MVVIMSYIKIRNGEDRWTDYAIQSVLDYQDIVVVDAKTGKQVYVSAQRIPTRTPVWRVIRAALKDAGIKPPRL
jgi:hypothetical protein